MKRKLFNSGRRKYIKSSMISRSIYYTYLNSRYATSLLDVHPYILFNDFHKVSCPMSSWLPLFSEIVIFLPSFLHALFLLFWFLSRLKDENPVECFFSVFCLEYVERNAWRFPFDAISSFRREFSVYSGRNVWSIQLFSAKVLGRAKGCDEVVVVDDVLSSKFHSSFLLLGYVVISTFCLNEFSRYFHCTDRVGRKHCS